MFTFFDLTVYEKIKICGVVVVMVKNFHSSGASQLPVKMTQLLVDLIPGGLTKENQ